MNAFRDFIFPVASAAAFVAAFAFQGSTPSPKVADPPEWKFAADPAGWKSEDVRFCQNEQCGRSYLVSRLGGATSCPECGGALAHAHLGELTVLPSDTRISRRVYLNALGGHASVAVIVGGASKRSIHRPELCLPSQGFILDSPRNCEIGGRPWHVLALRRGGEPAAAFAYTFFNQAGARTSSHMRRIFADVFDRTLLNRIDRWAMVTVQLSVPGGYDPDSETQFAALGGFLGSIVEDGK